MRPPLVETFRQLACVAEIRGQDDAGDFRRAVSFLDTLSTADLAAFERRMREAGHARSTETPDAAEYVYVISGGDPERALEVAHAGLPRLFRELLPFATLTTAEGVTLARDLGVLTLADLELARADGRLHRMLPVAACRIEDVLSAVTEAWRGVPLGRAWDLLSNLRDLLAPHPAISEVTIAGEARRCEPLVITPVLVVSSAEPSSALEQIVSLPGIQDVSHRGSRRALVVVQGVEVDIRVAAPDDYGTVLFTATGAATHVSDVMRRQRRPARCAQEPDVYRNAGLAWIPAEVRHSSGEIEAAAGGHFPALVQRSEIRGDLHMHSTYSDGQDTVEAMVRAAIALGYEYIAITDHSERAAAARTLAVDHIARQKDELARLGEAYPQVTILHGVEVDIMPDGELDFPDAVLESFDIVLASLHDPANQDGATLTRRCLHAIRHPLVNVITHPANRLVGRRDGYPLDYEAIYAAAAETGTALEVDGAPGHLDLDGEHARAAIAAGVTLTIDSDCHKARLLGRQMALGIGTARRGWVESRHVLNCRTLADVRAFIAAKR